MSQVLIVANRLPVSWTSEAGGERRLVRSPGGLVSALGPVAERMESAWLGTLDGSPNMEFVLDRLRLMTVEVDPIDFTSYYTGFANQVLWPLFHGLPERMSRGEESDPAAGPFAWGTGKWWESYVKVNRAFAERIAGAAAAAALVWVHDYHLLLVPEMLRKLRPDLRIAFFLHIPFPEVELLRAQSWAGPLLRGLCAADLIGVQREVDASRLRETQQALAAESAPSIRVFPASIDPAPYVAEARAALEAGKPDAVRHQYGLVGRKVLLSVDRLDYTKGVLERIAAFETMLEAALEAVLKAEPEERVGSESLPVLLQVLTPTRQDVEAYREYAEQVRVATDRVNERFADGDYRPIITLSEPHSAAELVQLFLIADVMCVTPLRDGMNLVAKEFVVSRVDGRGVLVLGREAGSADELAEAIIVDPRDPCDLVAGLSRALAMGPVDQASRARALSARVRSNDVFAWGVELLAAARHVVTTD